MDELRKIREVSIQYNISARTLRYYEDMGLLSSKRVDSYAYRLYDKAAVNRLEQILVLRRLNISIKDIQRIFSTTSSEAVLEVLGKKIENIDEEVSLLRELREIILEFIAQIKKTWSPQIFSADSMFCYSPNTLLSSIKHPSSTLTFAMPSFS